MVQKKQDSLTRWVNPTQALRLGNSKAPPPPHPLLPSSPVPPHLPLPPPARAQVLEAKSTQACEC